MRARAAVLRAPDAPFTIEDINVEAPREDEVLVRLVACGLCHTDVLSREAPPEYFVGPIVRGHEGAGVVEAVGGGVDDVHPGDHVVLSFMSCATCATCAAGRPAYCMVLNELNMPGKRPDGTTAYTDAAGARIGSHFFGQSSFSSLAVVARSSVVVVDPALDLIRLAPLGCGIMTGAGAVLNCLTVGAGESIVVAGAGAVGLAAIMAAKLVGAGSIVAVDRHSSRLQRAEKLGATAALNVPPGELAALVREMTAGGSDHALDTTGNAAVIRGMFDGLAYMGQLALCGVGFTEVSFAIRGLISGRRISGVVLGDARPRSFIPELARLNVEGRFPYHELIETFPLESINDAEVASRSGAVIKPVLTFG